MKKISFLSAFIMLSFALFGQDIIIRFTGSGEASEVSSVEVKNLSNGTSITVPNGNNSLNLTQGTLGIKEIQNTENIIISNYPNPFENSTNIEFYIEQDENITITITDITGKVIINKSQKLNKGAHSFEFTGGNMGTYFIKVSGINFASTSKIVCSGNNSNQANLIYNGQVTNNYKQKNSIRSDSKDFLFTIGDTLLLKGYSDNYITLMVVIPTVSTTYTFDFVTCSDVDGNNYPIVTIGNQIWMAENLKVTHYPNGDSIPNITDNTEWADLENNNTDDAYCYYNNDTSSEYGCLYTYAAAIGDNWQRDHSGTDGEGGQGVCPDGWHLPTDAEWQQLVDYLGGTNVADDKLKERDTTHWQSPNSGATNASGFTALPGGAHYTDGYFYNKGYYGDWWSASESEENNAWHRHLDFLDTVVIRYNTFKSYGFSVRCVKDN